MNRVRKCWITSLDKPSQSICYMCFIYCPARVAVKFSDQSFKHHTLEGATFGVDKSSFPLRYRTSNDVRRSRCYDPHDDARQRFHNNFREVNLAGFCVWKVERRGQQSTVIALRTSTSVKVTQDFGGRKKKGITILCCSLMFGTCVIVGRKSLSVCCLFLQRQKSMNDELGFCFARQQY